MRFKINLEVHSSNEEIEIPIKYQSIFLSLLKRGLENAAPEVYKELYEKNKEKLFSQAIIFKGAKFEKEKIILKTPSITYLFSTPKADLAMAVYNAFIYLKKMKAMSFIEDSTIKVKSVSSIYQETITEKQVVFQAVSPILARDHNRETRKDWFLDFNDEKYEVVLKQNLINRLVPEMGRGVQYDIENLKMKPLNMKKTVTKAYEKFYQGAIGTIELTGEPYLLNVIRDVGLGAKTGLYFGYLNQVKQGGDRNG
ncbi:CRISPR-associated endoribonuclease Cas6 [Enterococcus raffinosus]|uniref:CRISPR-associated endoribonuclease Cas6 n=1 Tax=Enterococcus raffinosus TaxID=71452 RepID=UPI001C11F6CE|nr:CRISPR-associated endoribonuclease Cas6 [Enterococcus raffinosus]MBU5360012.1 CRISPR-associated endoribonuclease Cas6 [Enterococcus raffinosus]